LCTDRTETSFFHGTQSVHKIERYELPYVEVILVVSASLTAATVT